MAITRDTRRNIIERLKSEAIDVLIIGGGINGAGTARDLALRAKLAGHSLKIALVEQAQFASGTSSKSSQLIHGGLRYLKYFEFNLVREALRERAVLLEIAPHLVEPLAFLMPISGLAAGVFYNTGLWIYEKFAGAHRVGAVRRLDLDDVKRMEPALSPPGMTSGAEFWDCRVNAARLVLENVFESIANGALAANYVSAEIHEDGSVTLHDRLSGESFDIRPRKIVDATGPWALEPQPRLVRGSHIVLPKILTGERAIAWFDEFGRIIFLIPWGPRRDLTLVGTTDVDHTMGPDNVQVSAGEIRYLLNVVRTLCPGVEATTPISTFSALRPLAADPSGNATAATREHRIWDDEHGIIRITGGKYTTYRAMSEEAADLVAADIAPELESIHATATTPVNGNSRAAIFGLGGELREYGVQADAVRQYLGGDPPSGLTPWDFARMIHAVNHEMACRLEDFLYVSTYLGHERSWSEEALASLRNCFKELSSGTLEG